MLDHITMWSKPKVLGWSHGFRSTPYLSHALGVRNVPDMVMKLRRKGHRITTERKRVVLEGRVYPDVAVYQFHPPKAKKK